MKKTNLILLLIPILLTGCAKEPEEKNTFIITFDANGGNFEGGLSSISTQINKGSILNYPPTPSRTGYEIKLDETEHPIWQNEGNTWSFSSTTVNEDMTLKCLWDAKEYSIIYDCDGGVNSLENPTSYTILDEVILQSATKVGSTFSGWLDDGGNLVSKIEVGSVGDLHLKANWTKNEYLLTAISDDEVMGKVEGTGLYHYEDEVSITANPNPGYEFDYFSVAGDETITYRTNPLVLNFTEEITLIAHFKVAVYTITYDYWYGWLQQGNNPTSYTIFDDFDFINPYYPYYDFAGFYDQYGNLVPRINKGTYGNLKLTAKYDPYLYNVSLSLNYENGATVTGAGVYGYQTPFTVEVFPNPGYEFSYMREAGEAQIAFYTNPRTYSMPHNNVHIVIYLNLVNYNINYILDEGTNNSKNPSKYNVLTDFEFKSPTKEGYTFLGWYTKEGERVTKITPGDFGDITLYAHWDIIKYNLKVTSEDESKGTVDLVESSQYGSDKVTVTAEPKEGFYFDGWYHGNYRLSEDETYEFAMPYNDLTLEARFFDKTSFDEREAEFKVINGAVPTIQNNIIKYGLIPQYAENDSNILHELNMLLTPSKNGYFYLDGHYFEKKGNKWFKCEPIRWRILEQQNNEYYVLSDFIIDSHMYSSFKSTFNNSEICAYLNGDFYNKAFYFDKSYIETMNMDGKDILMTLPSISELENYDYGFNGDSTRVCYSTEYAVASGLDSDYTGGYKCYWVRDYINDEYGAGAVLSNGLIDVYNIDCYTRRGVRPVMRFMIPSN